MADKTIDQLPNAAELDGSVIIPGIVGGVDSAIFLQLLSSYIRGEINPFDLMVEGSELQPFFTSATVDGARGALNAEEAGTAAALIAEIPPTDAEDIGGATPVGKGLITRAGWRYIADGADNTTIPILSSDACVLIEASGWAQLRLALPTGLYDAQEIVIATTGGVTGVRATYGAAVSPGIIDAPFADRFSCRFSWVADNSYWVLLG